MGNSGIFVSNCARQRRQRRLAAECKEGATRACSYRSNGLSKKSSVSFLICRVSEAHAAEMLRVSLMLCEKLSATWSRSRA